MEIDRTALKQQAREAMRLPQPSFWKVTLVFLLLSSGVNWLSDLLAASLSAGTGLQTPALFLSILFALYSAIISFGYQLWCLWTYRRQNPGLGALFQGFSIAGRVLWMQIIIMVQTFLFCIPLVLLSTLFLFGNSYPIFAMLVAVPIVVAAMIAFTYRFALAPYVLADNPDAGASLAIRRSAELMRGWKWELVKLYLSFWGWYALIALIYALVFLICSSIHVAAGIDLSGGVMGAVGGVYASQNDPIVYGITALLSLPLSLWLQPYLGVTLAGFYDNRIRLAQQQAADEMPPV